MCNRYSNKIGYRDYYDVLREIGIPLKSPAPDAAPNLEPARRYSPDKPGADPSPGKRQHGLQNTYALGFTRHDVARPKRKTA
jgi:hypothetical protein